MKLFAWLASAVVSAHRMDITTHEQLEADGPIMDLEDKRIQIDVTPWSSFNLQNPIFGVVPAIGTYDKSKPQVFRIVEKRNAFSLPDYDVFYAGTTDAILEQPRLLYSNHGLKGKWLASVENVAGKPIFQWTMSKNPVKNCALITSPAKGMAWRWGGEHTYYTMQQSGKTTFVETQPWLKTSRKRLLDGQMLNFTIDSGLCDGSKKSQCGRRVYNAEADRSGSLMRFFSPESDAPVAQSEKVQSETKKDWKGTANVYELTVAPGHDAILLTTFASFIDMTNNFANGDIPVTVR